MAKRQLISVNNLVDSIEFCIMNKDCFGEVFNISEKISFFNNKIYVVDKFNKLKNTEYSLVKK